MDSPALSRRETVAAVIPTKNALPLLRACLESVRWCDEIIVVDMFSTDGTVEAAREFPQCRVIQREAYIYDNFNAGMDAASTDWIIRLDSDEALTPELASELEERLRSADPTVAGFRAPVQLYFFGQRIHGAFARDSRETMFRKGAARYPVRSEHEGLVTTGRWLTCKGAYVHRTNPTVGSWIRKMDYYSDRDIERLAAPVRPSPARGIYVAIRMFLRMYFRLGCWRDGYAGFIVAWGTAFSMLILDAKMWEAWRRSHSS